MRHRERENIGGETEREKETQTDRKREKQIAEETDRRRATDRQRDRRRDRQNISLGENFTPLSQSTVRLFY